MKKAFASILSVLLIFPITFGNQKVYSSNENAPSKPADERVYLKKTVNTRIYQALKLIDDRNNWLRVSELLREVLRSDFEDPFMRENLELVKKEIDRAVIIDKVEERVVDWPYVVAKLRLIEALMANHVKLNVSYDREVPLIKSLLQSYFFPGQEEEGEIIFPAPATYRSEFYGYVKENIEKTETARSGEIDDPRFPAQKQVDKKKVPGPNSQPIGPSNSGEPHGRPNSFDAQGKGEKSPPQPLQNDPSGKPNFMTPEEAEQSLKLIREVLNGMKDLVGATRDEIKEFFEVKKIQNQYEPWAMLLQIIANPDSVNEDPQLNDFLNGVRLRVKLAEYKYVPEEQTLFKDLLTFDKNLGLTVEEDVNSTTGKVVLYVVSNLAGPGMLHFRYIMYLKKYLDIHPDVSGYWSAVSDFAQGLKEFGDHASFFQRMIRFPVGFSGRFVLGGAELVSAALTKGKTIALFNRIGTRVGAHWQANSMTYFKAAIILTMTGDLVEGAFQYLAARDPYERIDALQDVMSKELAATIYLLPIISQRAIFKYLGYAAFALDVGHLINTDIPNTSSVIKTVFGEYIPYYVCKWTTGYSLYDHMIMDYESQLGIHADDSANAIALFTQMMDISRNSGDLLVAKEVLEQTVKDNANRRLFIIYYMIQRFNNKSVSEAGYMEQRYWEQYQQYATNLGLLKEVFDQKMEKVKNQ